MLEKVIQREVNTPTQDSVVEREKHMHLYRVHLLSTTEFQRLSGSHPQVNK